MKKVIIEERKNNTFINLVITAILGFVFYFLFLPALNLTSMGFWGFIFLLFGVFTLLNLFGNIDSRGNIISGIKLLVSLVSLMGVVLSLIIAINFILSPIFNSKLYSKRIDVNTKGDFYKDIEEVDFDKLPLLDKASSQKLGDRVMGQMPELVSQFYVSDLYTQINYQNKIVRVTPLEYNGFFKYLANKKEGIKGYITVNSVSGKSKLVKLEKGMKYMDSAILMEDLNRKLRFTYPTKIFGEKSFEIDNDGNPYWVVPVLKYTGIEMLEEIDGVVLLDPITGKSKFYKTKDVPKWVDHVYSAKLIIEQLDDWGSYKNGFLNSLFGQKDVTMTTSGYNYTVMGDDVYLYTGITSVSSDESNLGFVLSNLRTKDTVFYSVPGAEEYSAMESAKGQVQQMNYTATFPLLINLNNKATYVISLKDKAGLVKMYAFVDVADYQNVVVTDAKAGIEEAAKSYINNANLKEDKESSKTNEITVESITTAVINGNTYYYITDTNKNRYYASVEVAKYKLPFLKNGDVVTITYNELSDINKISKLK